MSFSINISPYPYSYINYKINGSNVSIASIILPPQSVTLTSIVTYSDVSYTLVSIETSAFQDCSGLTNIYIPSSVTSIDTNAFQGCSGLKYVTFNGNIPTISSGNFGLQGNTAYYYNGAFNTNILSSFFTFVRCIDCSQKVTEKKCLLKCDKNKWDKFKFTSVGNNPNISYKQQISIKINTLIGGNTHYGNFYLGKTPQINYLGRTEGQPGGGGMPPKNKF
jgi:hypothetical protein